MQPYDLMQVALMVQKMRNVSIEWHSSDENKRRELEMYNRDLAHRLSDKYGIPVVYNPDDGTWRVGSLDGPLLFNLY